MADTGLTLDEWLPRVPRLLDECVERWQLRLGEPYPSGAAGLAVRVDLPDGTPAVLKLSNPHREAEQEADALERWDGDGAVRLLARDDERSALLFERCVPGTVLAAAPGALDVAAEREPWLAIDPKPLAGEREFAVASIVRSFELGHSKRDALYRLDRLTAELGLDRERARGWTIAQTVAWSGGSDYVAMHIETVSWLLEGA